MTRRIGNFNCVAVCALTLCLLCSAAGAASAAEFRTLEKWDRSLSTGVSYTQYRMTINGLPLRAHVLSVSLAHPDVYVRPMLANNRLDSLETVPSMARREGARAAINGSFFNRSSKDPFPVGFIMIDGRTLYFSHLHRSAFGLTDKNIPLFGYPKTQGIVYVEKTGEYFYLWGMNRRRRENEALAYTPEFGTTTGTNEFGVETVVSGSKVVAINNGNSQIPSDGFVVSLHGDSKRLAPKFQVGDRVSLFFLVEPSWLKVNNALTGGPLLVRGGRPVVDESTDEKLRQGTSSRIPITAVGSTADGYLLLVVVDGRQKKYSVGVTYSEMADFMRSIGAVNAIGMDGGGSSVMVIDGEIKNRPSDGSSRPVANGIGVFFR
ncbi:MAG TPA: phosphodiester glycosidase family protein [bacterium]|nr:phosphodiester glycosidase family protein [bacterium]